MSALGCSKDITVSICLKNIFIKNICSSYYKQTTYTKKYEGFLYCTLRVDLLVSLDTHDSGGTLKILLMYVLNLI